MTEAAIEPQAGRPPGSNLSKPKPIRFELDVLAEIEKEAKESGKPFAEVLRSILRDWTKSKYTETSEKYTDPSEEVTSNASTINLDQIEALLDHKLRGIQEEVQNLKEAIVLPEPQQPTEEQLQSDYQAEEIGALEMFGGEPKPYEEFKAVKLQAWESRVKNHQEESKLTLGERLIKVEKAIKTRISSRLVNIENQVSKTVGLSDSNLELTTEIHSFLRSQ